jgi:ACS family hexuronate transporter-like MFS transporter
MTPRLRWKIALLLSLAVAISYLDRQTLSVAIAAITRDIPISNTDFSRLQAAFLLAYAFMYAGGGKLIDALGTRRGFILIMIGWRWPARCRPGAPVAPRRAGSRWARVRAIPCSPRPSPNGFPCASARLPGIINAGTAAVVAAPP